MRRQHDELVSALWIGATEHRRDVLRLHLTAFHMHRRSDVGRQCKMRHRPAAVGQREHLGERMARTGEQLLGMRRVHRHRQLLAGGVVQ